MSSLIICFPKQTVKLPHPRWDGDRVLFEIADGGRHVPCAISRAALEDLSGRRHFGGAAFIKSFMVARKRIEEIARSRLKALSGGVPRTLNIWASNLDDLPPSSTPMEACRAIQRLSA